MTGDFPPFTYLWSNGATTQDINTVAAGVYTVDITDAQSCTYTETVTLSNSAGVTLTSTIQNQLCAGTNTGSIDLTVGSGTPPITYLWNTGATTQDISNLAPGTYSVTVTDGNSCLSTLSATINAITGISITGTILNENCGDQEGEIDISLLGGNAPYTFLWSNGMTTEDVTDLTQGSYTVTATDANGCQQNSTFQIINLVGNCIPNCNLSVTTSLLNDETCGNANGAIGLNISTTNAPYTILWNTGATTSQINNLSAGNYSVTVTDNIGCSTSQNFTITNQTGTLAISGSSVTNEVCGNGQGAVNITVSGGSQPYSFSWTNGATTEDISNLFASTFTVTVTDANGCSLNQSFVVQNQSGTLAQTYGNAMDETCGNGNGSIDIAIAGGQQPYTYNWSNLTTTQDQVNISAGSYTCTITDAAGCQITTPTYIVNNLSGTLAITNVNVDNEICGNNNGEILITVTGGTSPITYLWNTGATTPGISSLDNGTYSCTVTDATGCETSTGNTIVLDDPGTLQVVSVNVTNEICNNNDGIINLTVSGGTGPVSYLWNTGSNSQDLFQVSSGAFTCTISDSVGCTTTANAFVNDVPGTLQIDNMVVTNENCGNGTGAINLMISGQTTGVVYLWNNAATTQDISGLSAGTYTVTVSDNSGCQISGSATVTNNTGSFGLTLASLTNESCGNANGAIDIMISGGTAPISYLWSNGSTTEDISGLVAGNYDVTVTDGSGCVINSSSYTVNNTSLGLSISSAVVTDELCNNNNGNINITVNGGTTPYTYLWSNSSVTEDISGLNSGNYTITITDVNGCSTTASYTVNDSPGTLIISSAIITDEVCNVNNGAINISVTGGIAPYTYSWSNGPTTQDITGLTSGNYTVTVNSTGGCSTSSTYTVSNSSGNFQLSSVNTIDAVCSAANGSVDVTVSGGQAPITYLWNTGATTQDLANVAAGVYSCVATDNNGCQLNFSGVVNNDPGTLAVTTNTITSETCGQGNGAIDISVAGGSGSYGYIWSNGSTTADISSLANGTYTVTVSDGAGCSVNSSINVGGSGGNPVITGFTINDEICGQGNGSATVNVSGGTGPYTYNWSAPNCCTYTLTMTGGAPIGWTSATVEVYVNAALFGIFNNTGTTTTVNIPVCNGDAIALEYNPGGTSQKWYYLYDASGNLLFQAGPFPPGGPSYSGTASCNSGASGATYSGLSSGNYPVTVTDANGCTATDTAVVGNSAGTFFITNAVVIDESCGAADGSINISVAGSVNPVTYSWSNGATTQDISGIAAGTYTVNITNGNGCTENATYTIINVTGGTSITSSTVTNENCGDSTGTIDITMGGTASPYTYLWSNGATTEDLSALAAGTYDVTVTDAAGCGVTQSFTINNITNGLSASAIVTDESCTGGDGAIDLTITSAVPYSVLWSTTDTTEDLSPLGDGTYTYTITDSLGCVLSGSATIANGVADIIITNANVQDDFCDNNNGSINLTVSSSTPPLSYQWSSGETTQDINNISSGTYTVTITDGNGCDYIDSFVVVNTAFFFVSDTVIVNSTCGTCADGSINITVQGAGGLNYSWSNGATTQDISGLLPGTYTVTMTSGGGCTLIETYTVLSDTSGVTIAEHNFELLNVFPNPSNGTFNVELGITTSGNFFIDVESMLGQKVYSESVSMNKSGTLIIHLNNLERGIYLLTLSDEKDRYTKRIIISR